MKMYKSFLAFVFIVLGNNIFGQALKPHTDFDVQRYSFSVCINKNNDSVMVSGTIDFKLLKKTDTLVFDLMNIDKKGKGMKIISIKFGDKALGFRHANNLVYMQNPITGAGYSSISFKYKGVPANGLIIGKNKYGEKTWFSDHWPNRARYWLLCVDDISDKAKFDWHITAPLEYTVTANGVPTKEIVNNYELPTKIWEFKEDNPIATKVASIGIAMLQKDCFYNTCVPVCNYYYAQTYGNGSSKMSVAESILKFYDTAIAPYPFKKLNNVQSTTMFGGMENAGNIFYDEYAIDSKESNEALIAHEIAHQWFGNTVTEKNFSHLWLSEGFATFFTNYYIEKKYGLDSFNQRIADDRKRVGQFLLRSKRPVIDTSKNYMSLLNANSYQKGGLFLEALRRLLGEEIFLQVVREYYSKFMYKNADTEDFRLVAESVSKLDLKPLFDKWLYSTELPAF